MCDVTHSYVRHNFFLASNDSNMEHDSFISGTWRIDMWDMAHSYVGHDSFMRVDMRDTTCVLQCVAVCCIVLQCVAVCCSVLIYEIRLVPCKQSLISSCAAYAYSYVRHVSFICVTWLVHMCDMTHSYVWHDSFIYVTRLIHMRDMTHSMRTCSPRCHLRGNKISQKSAF